MPCLDLYNKRVMGTRGGSPDAINPSLIVDQPFPQMPESFPDFDASQPCGSSLGGEITGFSAALDAAEDPSPHPVQVVSKLSK